MHSPLYMHTRMHTLHTCTHMLNFTCVHTHRDASPSPEEGWGEVADTYTHICTHTQGQCQLPPQAEVTHFHPEELMRHSTHPPTSVFKSSRALCVPRVLLR